MDIANPSDEHQMLREMVRDFVNEHVEPQALEYDRDEKFNVELFVPSEKWVCLGLPLAKSLEALD